MTALLVCLANSKRRLLCDRSSPWDVLLEHIWERMRVKRADGFGISSFDPHPSPDVLPGVSAALGPARGRKIHPWNLRSAVS